MKKKKTFKKCLACKKEIRGIGIHYYDKESCLDCYRKAIKAGIIKPLTLTTHL